MAQQNDATDEPTATVSEDKFNGSATLEVVVPDDTDTRTVKQVARKFFRETHGTKPSRVVTERDDIGFGEDARWIVMVSDHSSGSLVDGEEYEL
jgi:hypothetical protein